MLEDWEDSETTYTASSRDARPVPNVFAAAQQPAADARREMATALKQETPLFTLETLERNATRSRGVITTICAANNVVIVGTNRGAVIRYDFAEGGATEVDTATKQVDAYVAGLFVDPLARHLLVVLQDSNRRPLDVVYIHARSSKGRPLAKMKGIPVSAVAWNKQCISEASVREVLVGTQTGSLYELAVDEKDKKERHFKHLFHLGDSSEREPVTAAQLEVVGGGGAGPLSGPRYLLLVVSATRFFVFTGMGSLESVFGTSAGGIVAGGPLVELPGEMPYSEVQVHSRQLRRPPDSFAWLAGPGIYHGDVHWGGASTSASSTDELPRVENHSLLPFPALQTDTVPVSLAITEFHFLLLYPGSLVAINRLSKQVAATIPAPRDAFSDTPGMAMRGLVTDHAASITYLYTDESLYEVLVKDEGRDMWRLHLQRREYAAALEHCKTSAQRDEVYSIQAEEAFVKGEFSRAAAFYARTPSAAPFEEVALKLIEAGQPDALRTFLLHKLDHLTKQERSQQTMLATWLTELYLDQINTAREVEERGPAGAGRGAEGAEGGVKAVTGEFRNFLADYVGVLDEATTVRLLSSYGCEQELVHFAALRGDHETVIAHHIRHGEALRALAVLRRPSLPTELMYKFAADLMAMVPSETVDAWIAAGSNLQARRLIPAVMRYTTMEGEAGELGRREAIRYLQHCVNTLAHVSQDPSIHNLLLALYVRSPDESSLLRFLQEGVDVTGEALYDVKYALRLCLEAQRFRACVQVYCMLAMFEEAVALALQVDLELAKSVADKPEDDDTLRKKLWLRVARHVVEQGCGEAGEGSHIRKAIAFLKETDGLLKIEDILPFFPDFVLIDDFKDAICTSLEEYNHQIEELKAEMNTATLAADNIRRDVAALAQRYVVVEASTQCCACARPLLQSAPSTSEPTAGSPFYVFPCSHSFHASCLVAEVSRKVGAAQRARIGELQRSLVAAASEQAALAAAPAAGEKGPSEGALPEVLPGGGAPAAEEEDPRQAALKSQSMAVQQLQQSLDDAVAPECPLCGDLMIRSITEPFITADEEDLAGSWSIHG